MRLIKELSVVLALTVSAPMIMGCGNNNQQPPVQQPPVQQPPVQQPPVQPQPAEVMLISPGVVETTGAILTLTHAGGGISANSTVTFGNLQVAPGQVYADGSQYRVAVPSLQSLNVRPGSSITLTLTNHDSGKVLTAMLKFKAATVAFGDNKVVPSAPDKLGSVALAYPKALLLADMTGDGRADLITANKGDNSISILRSDATTPNFTVSNIDGVTSPKAIAVGDFNLDGKMDLVAGNSTAEGGRIVLGSGNGGVLTSKNLGMVTTANERSLAVADFNMDGKADIAAVGVGGSTTPPSAPSTTDPLLLVMYGTGNVSGDFATTTALQLQDATFPVQALSLSNLNGDNKPDLALVSAQNVRLLVNQGNPGDTTTSFAALGTDLGLEESTATSVNAIASADITGDGLTDIIASIHNTTSEALSAVISDSTSQPFRKKLIASSVTDRGDSVATGDVNGDGLLDLVVANSAKDQVSIFLGKPSGTPYNPSTIGDNTNLNKLYNRDAVFQTTPIVVPVGDNPQSVVVCDFNGDGLADIATLNRDGKNITLLTNTSN